MKSAALDSKSMRGTKRICPACEVRFYDLARASIACPACGVAFVAADHPVAAVSATVGSYSAKAAWRSKGFKRPDVVAPVADPELDPAETPAEEDAAEPATAVVADDDVVLEQEPDDADVSDLVDHDVEEPKDR